jgi:F0F1-type ATP synthase assembly protein I
MENNNKSELSIKSEYWKIFTKVSAWIVVPVLISAFIGNYLDKKFDSAPWILGFALAVSFTVSMVAIVKIVTKYSKEQDKKDDRK